MALRRFLIKVKEYSQVNLNPDNNSVFPAKGYSIQNFLLSHTRQSFDL